jgi:hypothetical protein
MIQFRSMLLVFVALVLSVSFAVPAEDVPETAYDESESLPCESTPVVSAAVPETVPEAPCLRPRASWLRLDSLRRPGAPHLENRKSWADPISASLIILDHSLRC